MNEPRLVEDGWLSGHLGKRAFHVTGDFTRLDACKEDLAARLDRGPHFADIKIAVDDISLIRTIDDLGFSLIDTNLRFSIPRAPGPAPAPTEVGFARPDMAAAVGAIAEKSFVFDRFHRDPEISAVTANAIKRQWAEAFFGGKRGSWMVVACRNDVPIGFLLLLRSQLDELIIDLIAVDPSCRGKGTAQAMIGFASSRCDVAGPMVVGTQVANVPSVRLYEKLGFRMASAQYVFHRHGATPC